LVLPAPVPIQQLWNADEGWLARLYQVYNDDPFFGKVGAVAEYGEIAWAASGTPGAADYRTNGKRVLLRSGSNATLPIDALDANGVSYKDAGFTGDVSRIRYNGAIPVEAAVGSFFLTYVGRVTLTLQALDSGIVSNAIQLDLQTPREIVDESGVAGYLRPDAGRLNVNRLGGAPILPINVHVSRY
jgi:hypothetical protein